MKKRENRSKLILEFLSISLLSLLLISSVIGNNADNTFYYYNDFSLNYYNNGDDIIEFNNNYNRTGNNNYIYDISNITYINNSNMYIKHNQNTDNNNNFYTQYIPLFNSSNNPVLSNFKNYTIITKIKKISDYGDSTFGLYFYSQINNTNTSSNSDNGYYYLYSKESDSANAYFRFKGNEEASYLIDDVYRDNNTPILFNNYYFINFTVINNLNGSVEIKAKIWNSTEPQPNDYEISGYLFNAGAGILLNGTFGFITKNCNMLIDYVEFYSNDYKEIEFIPENAVSYWKLNNNTLDSINGNHGSTTSINFTNNNFIEDYSLSLNRNVPDYLNLSYLFISKHDKSFSFSLWINFSILDNTEYIISQYGGDMRFMIYVIKQSNNKIGYHIIKRNFNSYAVISNKTINNTNEFYNIVFQYSGINRRLELWVNGQFEGNDTFIVISETPNSNKFYVGNNPQWSGTSGDFNIDEISYFDKFLNENEIKQIYRQFGNETEEEEEEDIIPPNISKFIYPENNSLLYDFNGSIIFNITESGNCSLNDTRFKFISKTDNNKTFHFKNISNYIDYGNISIRLYCRDNSYNWNNNSILNFTYLYNDTIPPYFNIFYPLNNSYLNNVSWNLSIILFNLSDNIGIDKCWINNSRFIKVNNTNFLFNDSYDYDNIIFNNLNISCNDTSGNVYSITDYFFTIDSQPPVLLSYSNIQFNYENISFTVNINESSLMYWQYGNLNCNSYSESGNTEPNYHYPSYTIYANNLDDDTTYYFNISLIDRANNSNIVNSSYCINITTDKSSVVTQVIINMESNKDTLLFIGIMFMYFAFLFISFNYQQPMLLIFTSFFGIFISLWLWFDTNGSVNIDFPKILIALFLMFNAYLIIGNTKKAE